MKHLYKFFNHANVPWVSLIYEAYYSDRLVSNRPIGSVWWKGILKLLP